MVKIITSLSVEKRLAYLIDRLKSSTKSATGGSAGVLIVPEQFLFETERSMYNLLGPKKVAVTEITGFSKLANDVIKQYGEPKLYADDIVKSVTMYKTLNRLKSGLTYFKGVSSYDFTCQMLDIVDEFKSAAVTPAMLRGKASEIDLSKLSDIAEIYSTYNETLTADFADKLDDNANAAELINLHDCFVGKEVFLYQFDNFSTSQIGFVKALSESADTVEILLRTDSRVSGVGEFRSMNSLISKIEREMPCEFHELGGGSYSPVIELWSAANVSDEFEFVAAKIRQLITVGNSTGGGLREQALCCNEIAVLACDSVNSSRMREAMLEYDVPCYVDLPESIITKPMTRFIISALEAVNLDTPELLSYIRSGFVRVHQNLENYDVSRNLVLRKFRGKDTWYEFNKKGSRLTRRLSKRSMDLFERVAYRYALTHREWAKPFPQQNRDLSACESLRAEIVQPIVDLRDACKDTTGARITEVLCEFLLETMQLQRTVLGLCEGSHFLESKNITDEFRQLWDLVIDVFESLHESLKDYCMSLSEYTELLKGVFSSVNIAKPPQVLDAVVIGDLERSRLSDVKVVFIVGANVGNFPKSAAINATGGFSSKEIEMLSKNGLEMTAKLEERYNYERLMVNKALTLPSERLYISAPLSNVAWEELLLAPIFDELENSGLTVNKTMDLSLDFRIRTMKSAWRIFAETGMPDLEEIVRRDGVITAANIEQHNLAPETAQKLFNFEKFSPTAIETMMGCRFKFFCKYGLDIDIPIAENDEEPIAMERGNIIHFCLDRAMRNMHNLNDSNLDSFVESCIWEYREFKLPFGYAQTKRQQYILSSFKTGIVRMLRFIRSEFEVSNFVPSQFESRVDFIFGNVRLGGIIDRVDRRTSGAEPTTPECITDYIRVIDYKTGSKEMDFPSVFYGLDMQMLLYLFAVTGCFAGASSDAQLKPAAALYLPSDGSKVKGVLMPGASDVEMQKNWLSVHTPSGVAIESRMDTAVSKKVRVMSPTAYNKLKDYCEKLVDEKVKQVKRGDVAAVPVVHAKSLVSRDPAGGSKTDTVCEYCEFSLACGKKEVVVINKDCIEEVIADETHS